MLQSIFIFILYILYLYYTIYNKVIFFVLFLVENNFSMKHLYPALLGLLLMSIGWILEGKGHGICIFSRLSLHIAGLPRRRVVPMSTPAVRDGPSHHPC